MVRAGRQKNESLNRNGCREGLEGTILSLPCEPWTLNMEKWGVAADLFGMHHLQGMLKQQQHLVSSTPLSPPPQAQGVDSSGALWCQSHPRTAIGWDAACMIKQSSRAWLCLVTRRVYIGRARALGHLPGKLQYSCGSLDSTRAYYRHSATNHNHGTANFKHQWGEEKEKELLWIQQQKKWWGKIVRFWREGEGERKTHWEGVAQTATQEYCRPLWKWGTRLMPEPTAAYRLGCL